MGRLQRKIINDRYIVKAVSQGVTRNEVVSTDNPIFKGAKTSSGIKGRYEAFWNTDTYDPKVKVIKVTKVRKNTDITKRYTR
jgi:hypothetical protein